jgi:hypothetical protein
VVETSTSRVVRGISPPASGSRVVRRDIYQHVPTRGLLGWDRLPVVLDTSMLINDIVDAARGQGGSLLLLTVRKDVAHLYATERVREEVERNLERRAIQGRVSPERAFAVWRERYLPAIRFVSVEDVPRGRAVAELAARHPNDLPTGVLAELLAPCLVFARDNDLVDTGIARRDWTTIVHNAEEAKQLELLFSGGGVLVFLVGALGVEGAKGLIRLARAAPIPTLVGGAAATLLLHSHLASDRGRTQITEAKSLFKDVGSRLSGVIETADRAQSFVRSAAFVLEAEPTELAHAARAVAVAPEPPRAGEVAYELNATTQKAAYVLRHPLFTRTGDGRYLLGRSYAPIESQPVEIV